MRAYSLEHKQCYNVVVGKEKYIYILQHWLAECRTGLFLFSSPCKMMLPFCSFHPFRVSFHDKLERKKLFGETPWLSVLAELLYLLSTYNKGGLRYSNNLLLVGRTRSRSSVLYIFRRGRQLFQFSEHQRGRAEDESPRSSVILRYSILLHSHSFAFFFAGNAPQKGGGQRKVLGKNADGEECQTTLQKLTDEAREPWYIGRPRRRLRVRMWYVLVKYSAARPLITKLPALFDSFALES